MNKYDLYQSESQRGWEQLIFITVQKVKTERSYGGPGNIHMGSTRHKFGDKILTTTANN